MCEADWKTMFQWRQRKWRAGPNRSFCKQLLDIWVLLSPLSSSLLQTQTNMMLNRWTGGRCFHFFRWLGIVLEINDPDITGESINGAECDSHSPQNLLQRLHMCPHDTNTRDSNLLITRAWLHLDSDATWTHETLQTLHVFKHCNSSCFCNTQRVWASLKHSLKFKKLFFTF